MGNLIPKLYDAAMRPFEKSRFYQIRAAIAGNAQGKVLEIGSGTGVNFPFYKKAALVKAIEPDRGMRKQSEKRAANAKVPIQLYDAKAEELPFAADEFDAVVATLVFCTIPEPEQALREIRRCARKGAKIYFFEHVRMDQKPIGTIQDAVTPLWKKVAGGCHLNRDTLQLIRKSGLTVTDVKPMYGGLFLAITCVNEK